MRALAVAVVACLLLSADAAPLAPTTVVFDVYASGSPAPSSDLADVADQLNPLLNNIVYAWPCFNVSLAGRWPHAWMLNTPGQVACRSLTPWNGTLGPSLDFDASVVPCTAAAMPLGLPPLISGVNITVTSKCSDYMAHIIMSEQPCTWIATTAGVLLTDVFIDTNVSACATNAASQVWPLSTIPFIPDGGALPPTLSANVTGVVTRASTAVQVTVPYGPLGCAFATDVFNPVFIDVVGIVDGALGQQVNVSVDTLVSGPVYIVNAEGLLPCWVTTPNLTQVRLGPLPGIPLSELTLANNVSSGTPRCLIGGTTQSLIATVCASGHNSPNPADPNPPITIAAEAGIIAAFIVLGVALVVIIVHAASKGGHGVHALVGGHAAHTMHSVNRHLPPGHSDGSVASVEQAAAHIKQP